MKEKFSIICPLKINVYFWSWPNIIEVYTIIYYEVVIKSFRKFAIIM